MKKIKLRGHHLYPFKTYLLFRQENHQPDKCVICSKDYGKEFIKNLIEKYEKIYQTPDLKIRIVESLDDLCLGGCKKLKECKVKERAEDKERDKVDEESAIDFNLKIGKTYSAKELVDRLLER